MSSPFAGRSFVVTGAAGNLGGLVTGLLLSRGAHVVGVVRKASEAGPFAGAAGLGDAAARYRAHVTELSDEAGVAAAFDLAASLAPVWGLVNAAGAWDGGKSVTEAPLSSFEKMVDANLRSAFVTGREALKRMGPAGGGRIVFVAAFIAQSGVGGGGNAAYAASKAGVIGLAKALSEEGHKGGVRVNCIAPHTMLTAAAAAALPAGDKTKWLPMEQAAEAIVSLCTVEPLAVDGAVLTLPAR
jgi:NAD(P)-dependent dehydrogenase (short-subunit alcohol dehydrogenase family)